MKLAVIFAGAVVGEAVARRMFRPLHRFLPALDVRTEFGQLGALLVNAVIRFFELSAFVLVAIALFFAIYDGHQAARYAFWCVLFDCYTGAADRDRLRVLLAPSLPELRLPELDNRAARRLYWSLVSVTALVVGAGLVATFLHDIGLPEPLHQAASIRAAGHRNRGHHRRDLGRAALDNPTDRRSAPRTTRSGTIWPGCLPLNWHVFATCIVIAIAVAAFFNRLLTGERQAAHIYRNSRHPARVSADRRFAADGGAKLFRRANTSGPLAGTRRPGNSG